MLYNYCGKRYDSEIPEDRLSLAEEVYCGLPSEDQGAYWNDWCDENNMSDSRVYSMDELEFFLEGVSAYEVLTGSVVDLENFNSAHDWFSDSIYGLTSSNDIYDLQSPLDEEGFEEFLFKKIEAHPYNFNVDADEDDEE